MGITEAALGGMSMAGQTKMQQAAGIGMAALLGPFAPLAMAGYTAARGIGGYLKGRAAKREAMGMASLSPGLAGKRMGVPESMGASKYKAKGWGKGIMDAIMGVKPVGSEEVVEWGMGGGIGTKKGAKGRVGAKGGTLGGLTQQMMVGALISGLSMFNAAQAMRSGWTKKVLDLLEGKGNRGGGGLGGLLGGGLGLLMQGLLIGAAGVIGWQVGKWLGNNIKWGGKNLNEHTQATFLDLMGGSKQAAQNKAYENLSKRQQTLSNIADAKFGGDIGAAARWVKSKGGLPGERAANKSAEFPNAAETAIIATSKIASAKVESSKQQADIAKIDAEKKAKEQEKWNAPQRELTTTMKKGMDDMTGALKKMGAGMVMPATMNKDVSEELYTAVNQGYNLEQ